MVIIKGIVIGKNTKTTIRVTVTGLCNIIK
jgi:hypothetical protein